MSPGYPPQRGAPNPNGRQGQQPGQPRPWGSVGRPATRSRFPGQSPVVARTDPSLYEWDRLSTEQQQAVLRTIRLSQHGGMSGALRMAVVLLVILGLLAAFAVLTLLVFHLGGITVIPL